MATFANSIERMERAHAEPAPQTKLHAARDPYLLRPLPGEDLYNIHFKQVDNSRLVREPDPQARKTAWSAIGVAALAFLFVTGVLAPSVANTLAGYKLEALRSENRRLLDERRALQLQEAELVAPERLEQLAQHRNMVVPQSNQVVHLNGTPAAADAAVAMIH